MRETFHPSELIINPDGSVYHLHLCPEELAPLIITVGDPGRVGTVSHYFDKIVVKKQYREFVTHTGYFNQRLISVISTGIGPDNIDIVFNELDALANVDFAKRCLKPTLTSLKIIRIGTCGALQPEVGLDSWVVSSDAFGFDNLMAYYRVKPTPEETELARRAALQFANAPATPYVFTGSQLLRKQLSPRAFSGITATCPGFYGPQGRAIRGVLRDPHFFDQVQSFRYNDKKVLNFEMETAAIYGLSRMLGHEACSMSAVVANRCTKQFSTKMEQTLEALILYVLEQVTGGVDIRQ